MTGALEGSNRKDLAKEGFGDMLGEIERRWAGE